MKITDKVLSIPPYISAPWSTIASLQTRPNATSYTLFITLKNGTQVEVPGLDLPALNQIFEAHSRHTEAENGSFIQFPLLPLQEEGSISAAGSHNPAQSNIPDLAPDILEKMANIAKSFGLNESPLLEPPVENCNCIYCQMARAIQKKNDSEEELITEADLHFRDWEIQQQDRNLYLITNPLDANEQYHVYLGTPIGCTCGEKNCEHIKAVLTS